MDHAVRAGPGQLTGIETAEWAILPACLELRLVVSGSRSSWYALAVKSGGFRKGRMFRILDGGLQRLIGTCRTVERLRPVRDHITDRGGQQKARPVQVPWWSCATAILALASIGVARAAASPEVLLDWGLDAQARTVATLRVPGSSLYAETASLNGQRSGGNGGFAYVWPLSTQFRVQNSLTRIDPAVHTPILRQFSDEARSRYWSQAGGGYRSGVGGGTTRFYDDNAHMAVALMEAYRITGDPVYLARARETYDFVLSGEDSAGGGGIYFHENDFSVKETISTLQGARAAVMLYRATGEEPYLADATRLYEWAEAFTQTADGLFFERYYLTGPRAGTAGDHTLINAAGDAILLNLEFHAATGGPARLQEAQRIANRSLTRYFNLTTGAINDEGYWAFELVDALCDLSRVDGNPLWVTRTVRALEWLHANRRDPNGHYGTLWGRGGTQATALSSWHLNDQAAVGRAYLHTALSLIEPADSLRLELSRPDSASPFRLKLSGPSGTSGRIQISDDLRIWQDGFTFSLGEVPLEIAAPGSGSSDAGFYRAVSP
jgi:hypothetical protein